MAKNLTIGIDDSDIGPPLRAITPPGEDPAEYHKRTLEPEASVEPESEAEDESE